MGETGADGQAADGVDGKRGTPAYAGIGSRKTPGTVMAAMGRLAGRLAERGWMLRSGGAKGADAAFQGSAPADLQTIYLPWKEYNNISGGIVLTPNEQVKAQALVRRHHGAWERCGRGARALHGRNAAIINRRRLDEPVQAVICWTPDGAAVGGTATGMAMARATGIRSPY